MKTMPFRSSRRMNRLHPVKSYKHIVDIQAGLVLAVQQDFTLIDAVDAPVLANTAQVQTASTVNAIFLHVECSATTSAALANVYMFIMKNPSNALPIPAANAVGASDVKKQIIHQEMVMVERSTAGNPRALFKGVVLIPRGYRRFGQDDALKLAVLSPGVNLDLCIQCIYKEFR